MKVVVMLLMVMARAQHVSWLTIVNRVVFSTVPNAMMYGPGM